MKTYAGSLTPVHTSVASARNRCTRLQGKQMLAHFSISPCIINNKHTEFREKKSGSYRVCLRVNIRVFLFISKRSLGLLLLFRKNHANICYPCGRVLCCDNICAAVAFNLYHREFIPNLSGYGLRESWLWGSQLQQRYLIDTTHPVLPF